MLVKALRLYNRDLKLTADELRSETPMIGRLKYTAAPHGGRDGRGALTCMLMPHNPQVTEPLVQLFGAKILKIDERGIRIGGEEDEWRRKERTSYKQVLWCWSNDTVFMTLTEPAPNSYAAAGKRAMA